MLCDNCKERDAVINLTQVEHDSKVTLHLCERCAQEKGVAPSMLPSPADGLRCAECGGTLRDFREAGRLGCAQCYEAFATHLRDLLRRLHGSSQHVGERYVNPGEQDSDPQRLLLELREQLRKAVENENFELAAELRDRIRVLE